MHDFPSKPGRLVTVVVVAVTERVFSTKKSARSAQEDDDAMRDERTGSVIKKSKRRIVSFRRQVFQQRH